MVKLRDIKFHSSFKNAMKFRASVRCYFRWQCEDKFAMIMPFPPKKALINVMKKHVELFVKFLAVSWWKSTGSSINDFTALGEEGSRILLQQNDDDVGRGSKLSKIACRHSWMTLISTSWNKQPLFRGNSNPEHNWCQVTSSYV